jgi:hypothetical protein
VLFVAGERARSRLTRRSKQTYPNMREQHGRHSYQHEKTDLELVVLQSDRN